MKTIDTDKLLQVGIVLSKEKDSDLLLETILTAAIDITGCDGGTLYIKTDSALAFRTMITRSLGIRKNGKNEPIELPPVALSPKNVCARAALDGTLINVADVYNDSRYDFSGPREYDKLTGYRTESMLVVPMEDDHGEIIGVLQLINAKSDAGATVPFDNCYEEVIASLASQAAICLTNINYANEVIELLESFVRVMSAAIDARSPYNANHTRNMVKYAERFIDRLNTSGNEWTFSDLQRRQFIMSVGLHDVGKIVIPLEIMDKESRLGDRLAVVEHRFEVLALQNRIDLLEGKISVEAASARERTLDDGLELIHQANKAGFLQDDTLEAIQALGEASLLEPDELNSLSVRKGTLTAEERAIIEGHVTMTAKLLGQMAFSRDYRSAPVWAAAHHELLNGTGYPDKLSGESIPREVRLLSILDIFDALTARDRPYKPAMPVEKALTILSDMVRDRQLDADILALFTQYAPWEDTVTDA